MARMMSGADLSDPFHGLFALSEHTESIFPVSPTAIARERARYQLVNAFDRSTGPRV